jgi:DNA-binding NtrC family response regulator
MISHKDSMHILIADDDEDDRTFLEAMMELKMNNKLTLFNDGKDLMDYLSSNPDNTAYCFLDLNMPYMSGLNVLKS